MNTTITNANLTRRDALLAASATVVSFGSLSGLHAAEHDSHHGSSSADVCVKACADTMMSCSKHVSHCTQKLADGDKDYVKCLEMCHGCLQMSGACVSTCYGPMAVLAAEACAKACELCAAECEKLTADKAMKAHAKLCRDCAQACRDFIKAHA